MGTPEGSRGQTPIRNLWSRKFSHSVGTDHDISGSVPYWSRNFEITRVLISKFRDQQGTDLEISESVGYWSRNFEISTPEWEILWLFHPVTSLGKKHGWRRAVYHFNLNYFCHYKVNIGYSITFKFVFVFDNKHMHHVQGRLWDWGFDLMTGLSHNSCWTGSRSYQFRFSGSVP